MGPSKYGKRKHIKFGNMSLYFFREEGSFQRKDTVEFPKVDPVSEPVVKTVSFHIFLVKIQILTSLNVYL